MIPIKYGTRTVMLGIHDPFPFQCPNCKGMTTVSFAIHGEYYHVWYVPIFPFEKDGFATCSSCSFRINSLKFNKLTKEEFKQIKKKFRYPFYAYIGVAIPLLLILLGIMTSLISSD